MNQRIIYPTDEGGVAVIVPAPNVAYMKAQEAGTDTTAIVAEKQRLRNITMLCDTATSVAELKAINISND